MKFPTQRHRNTEKVLAVIIVAFLFCFGASVCQAAEGSDEGQSARAVKASEVALSVRPSFTPASDWTLRFEDDGAATLTGVVFWPELAGNPGKELGREIVALGRPEAERVRAATGTVRGLPEETVRINMVDGTVVGTVISWADGTRDALDSDEQMRRSSPRKDHITRVMLDLAWRLVQSPVLVVSLEMDRLGLGLDSQSYRWIDGSPRTLNVMGTVSTPQWPALKAVFDDQTSQKVPIIVDISNAQVAAVVRRKFLRALRRVAVREIIIAHGVEEVALRRGMRRLQVRIVAHPFDTDPTTPEWD